MKAVIAATHRKTALGAPARYRSGWRCQGIDEMKATGIDDPELRYAVMDGMEAPQARPFVGEAVGGVEAGFDDHQG